MREYNNALAFAYLNMAIKLGVDNDWESAWLWLLESVHIGKRVQKHYHGDYHSAYTLKKSYTALNMLSQEDMTRHIDKYDRIMKYTRPLSTY